MILFETGHRHPQAAHLQNLRKQAETLKSSKCQGNGEFEANFYEPAMKNKV